MKATFVMALWLALLAAAASADAEDGVSGWGAVVGAPELDRWVADSVSDSPAIDARRGDVHRCGRGNRGLGPGPERVPRHHAGRGPERGAEVDLGVPFGGWAKTSHR